MKDKSTPNPFIQLVDRKELTGETFGKRKREYYMRHFPPGLNKLYADFKLNADKFFKYKAIRDEFFDKNGYRLNLDSPQSYNEKLIWKKLYDRNPLLTLTADKYLVRSYIKQLLGKEEAEKILIPLYHVTDNPDTIPFDELPERFVVKPNHGSKMHWIVTGDNDRLKGRIREKCRQWLQSNYGLYDYQWAYRNIKRKIIVEKLLLTKDCNLPMDFKLFCFHGKGRFFRISKNRFGKDDLNAYYDTDWNFIPVKNFGYAMMNKILPRPSNLEYIIELAEKLAVNFDAVRVDLFCFDDKVYFGELTHYHAAGLSRFEPVSFDFELGSYWKVKKNYWR